jgi:hypothetical protein
MMELRNRKLELQLRNRKLVLHSKLVLRSMKERSSSSRTNERANLASCSKELRRSTKEQLRNRKLVLHNRMLGLRSRKLVQRHIRKLGLRSHKLVLHSNRCRNRSYTIFRTGQPMRSPR